jgi:TldD protein
VQDRLIESLKQARADYAEVRFEMLDQTVIALRGSEVDHVSSAKVEGGIARACTRGGWGTATFDRLDGLASGIREACENAALVGREKTRLAEGPIAAGAEVRARMKRDWRGVGLDAKLALVKAYNDLLLKADPAIATSHVHYTEAFRTVHFASTRGASFTEERPRLVVALGAVARAGSLVQNARDGVSSAVDWGVAEGLEARAEAAAKRAAALLKAPPCPGGPSTVVLDQELAGVFAHEAFGHLSEADFLYENPRMRDLMHLGRPMGVKRLNLADDGAAKGLIGSAAYDDEGTPTGKTYLIKEGVLVGHLHSLETAGTMGARPTGNARAIGRSSEPIVRMTNTAIEAGQETFEELLAGADRGIYACSILGGQTMMEMFTFSAAHGRRIENGRLGDLVRDVVLTGNVFETLNRIDGFGDDFEVPEKGGGCGKGGQSPLPVTFGGPHLRVRDVVIGGR